MSEEISKEELYRLVEEGFDFVQEHMATKEDLKALVTKEEFAEYREENATALDANRKAA